MQLIRNNEWKVGELYKKRILLDDLKDKINLIQEVVIKPGVEVPMHKHEHTDEIFYVVSGNGTMTVEDKEIEIRLGDLIIVEKNEMHSVKADGEVKFLICKANYKKGDSYLS